MATNLRKIAESDLSATLEGEFGLPVELVDPDGELYTGINGQVLYDTVRINPDTGEEMVVNNPIVVIRRASLSRVPAPGEKWFVRIPVDPDPDADKDDFVIDPTRPPEGGRSIGFIRLYLRRAVQT